ncbi:MAG TPA: hypothetical protein VIM33_12680 [Gaiellaceae bacterium]|jgi:hypothetical protein
MHADPVVDATRAFLDELMPILKERCPEDEDQAIEVPSLSRWILELDMGHAMRRYRAVPVLFTAEQQCAARLLGEFREAGYAALVALDSALAADPIVGPRIAGESLVSFGAGGGAFQGPGLIQLLVDVAFSEGVAHGGHEALATRWVEFLRRPSDRVTAVIALREFEISTVPFALEPDLIIDELSEAEVAVAVRFGGGLKGLSADERMVARTFAIKTTFESRVFVGDVPIAEHPREQAAREKAEAQAALALRALQVFKRGRVSASATFQYTARFGDETTPVQGSVGPGFGWHAAEPYVLDDGEAAGFRDFWLAFKETHARPAIASALRRFNFAAERGLPDDEIVDLMIAAEALFLKEIDERYRGELSYRLGLRAASLLGRTLDERLRLFKFMRRAYDARSVVVHGGVHSGDDLMRLDGSPATVHEFADDLEGIVREALQRAIRSLAQGEAFPPAWEELVLAGPTG